MQKLRNLRALASGLLAVVLAFVSAEAQDYGGADRAPLIDWRTSYRLAAAEAARDGKPLLVRVTANWCGPCRQMKQLTFADSRVIELVQSGYIPLIIDADENPDLVAEFRVEAFILVVPNWI